MTEYRKKPVIINAVQWSGFEFDLLAMREFTGMKWLETITDNSNGSLSLVIPTLEGNMVASPGDFIIRGVAGEFYPCKPDIFWQTYEPVWEV